MRPDAENDTHSPWFEAFTPHSHPPLDGVRLLAGATARAEDAARPEFAEPDGATQALFDCYNG